MIFKIYKDSANNWRWMLQRSNHSIVAISAEGFPNKSECLKAIRFIQESIPIASVVEISNYAQKEAV